MTISREKIISLLGVERLITGGDWSVDVTTDGNDICVETERTCNCEENNKDCLFDCVCDEDVSVREVIGTMDIRFASEFAGADQGVLDAEFLCCLRNNFAELARAYIDLLDQESGDCGD